MNNDNGFPPVDDGRNKITLDLSWIGPLLLCGAIAAALWYGGPFVHRWWDRMGEIRPHEYAQIEAWDNEYTHDYIQESLDDGVITGWEYTQVYWMLNDGWAERLKDDKK